MLVFGWRFGDHLEIICGEEECGGVATTIGEDQRLQRCL